MNSFIVTLNLGIILGHPGIDQVQTHTITSKEHPVNCIFGSAAAVQP